MVTHHKKNRCSSQRSAESKDTFKVYVKVDGECRAVCMVGRQELGSTLGITELLTWRSGLCDKAEGYLDEGVAWASPHAKPCSPVRWSLSFRVLFPGCAGGSVRLHLASCPQGESHDAWLKGSVPSSTVSRLSRPQAS